MIPLCELCGGRCGIDAERELIRLSRRVEEQDRILELLSQTLRDLTRWADGTAGDTVEIHRSHLVRIKTLVGKL
jgi:hypothetical protein